MFNNLLEKRRSIYNLGKNKILSNQEIKNTIEHAIKHAPSAFNCQSARVVVLFDKNSEKFWDATKEILRKIVPAEKFAPTNQKMDSFKGGFGTILFFEETKTIEDQQKQMPLYAKSFPIYSEHGNAILQYAIWMTLAEKNIGASLQHYSPLVDEEVQKIWNISKSWRLIAQMPFGSIESPADKKDFLPIEDRMRTYG